MPGAQDKPAGPAEGYPVVLGPPTGPPQTDTGRADAPGHHDDHQLCPDAGWALDQALSSGHALCPPAPPGTQLTPRDPSSHLRTSLGPCSQDLRVLSALIHKHYEFQTKIKPERETEERREKKLGESPNPRSRTGGIVLNPLRSDSTSGSRVGPTVGLAVVDCPGLRLPAQRLHGLMQWCEGPGP